MGSTTVALSGSGSGMGSVIAAQLFAPYGGVRYSSGTIPTARGFTGQYGAASTTGLMDYGARYYDPAIGQFTSADFILPGNGYDPWGLSHYAYVEGNPLIRTDPTGHDGLFGGLVSAVSSAVSTVASTVVSVAQAAAPVAAGVVDAATGISSMVSDVKTIFSGNTSLLDKVLAGADLLVNVAMDVSMVVGLGEGLKAAYVGMKAAGHLVEEVGVHAAEDASEHAIEHEVGDQAEHTSEELFREGVSQAEVAGDEGLDDEARLQKALMSKEDQAYATAKKFGINLGKRELVYAPDEFGVGQLAKVAKADPWVIKLGEGAFVDERTLASTIAHELAHSRDYVQFGEASEEAGQAAQRAFEEWYDGLR